jgi:hypothetical protein
MTDAIEMRTVIPFSAFEKKRREFLSAKFGGRLILLWPFSETNATAMRTIEER